MILSTYIHRLNLEQKIELFSSFTGYLIHRADADPMAIIRHFPNGIAKDNYIDHLKNLDEDTLCKSVPIKELEMVMHAQFNFWQKQRSMEVLLRDFIHGYQFRGGQQEIPRGVIIIAAFLSASTKVTQELGGAELKFGFDFLCANPAKRIKNILKPVEVHTQLPSTLKRAV